MERVRGAAWLQISAVDGWLCEPRGEEVYLGQGEPGADSSLCHTTKTEHRAATAGVCPLCPPLDLFTLPGLFYLAVTICLQLCLKNFMIQTTLRVLPHPTENLFPFFYKIISLCCICKGSVHQILKPINLLAFESV